MTGEAWNCPHCGERILRSAPTCPACLRHLRFDAVAVARPPRPQGPLTVDGTIRHPAARRAGILR
jgi:predicted amidophosphoribosyltransferase